VNIDTVGVTAAFCTHLCFTVFLLSFYKVLIYIYIYIYIYICIYQYLNSHEQLKGVMRNGLLFALPCVCVCRCVCVCVCVWEGGDDDLFCIKNSFEMLKSDLWERT